MAESLRGGLSLALSGFAYWAHDIGGFKAEGAAGGYALVTPKADIYKRWVPFGLLSSHSRLHGSGSYRTPWTFDDEACDVLRKFTKLKHRLEPYIRDLGIHDAAQNGYPLLRAMFLEFPSEQSCWNLDMQYMFGDKLLVAPVFDAETVDYYVPEAPGAWVNILSGEAKIGGRWYSENFDMLNLPLLLRPDVALVIGQSGHRIGEDLAKTGISIIISDSLEGKIVTPVRGRARVITVTIGVRRSENQVSIDIDCEDTIPWEVCFVGGGVGLDDLDSRPERKVSGSGNNGVVHIPL